MYRVSIELYKHEWKFGRTRNAVGTVGLFSKYHLPIITLSTRTFVARAITTEVVPFKANMTFHSNFDQFTIQGHPSLNHSFIFKGSIFKTFKIPCEDCPLREHQQLK